MNKVFKVVYSKSKGCYVVVPETAKNNNGKKKVLASVLAGLALVGGAVAGNPAHAIVSSDGSINTEIAELIFMLMLNLLTVLALILLL